MWVLLSLITNLGLLGFFKYGGFLLENFVVLLNTAGIQYEPALPDIVLPVGISFYTFQTLSYTLDVYRGKTRPWMSFLDFALFVTFFPQLVAGPIIRSGDFLPQCIEPRRATGRQLSWGLTLLVLGLFEKIVVADGLLAPISDKVYAQAGEAGFLDAWCGTLAFSGQIFCDFAGYSTCAIGIALCLGFAIQDNFRFPYAAGGFSDFWRRWHVSLSSWLRDYLYI
ncbi:MAG: MBOAT family O-acyltransferase, partial [Planctomycetota bacterium]